VVAQGAVAEPPLMRRWRVGHGTEIVTGRGADRLLRVPTCTAKCSATTDSVCPTAATSSPRSVVTVSIMPEIGIVNGAR
jgi:hypothetical protein